MFDRPFLFLFRTIDSDVVKRERPSDPLSASVEMAITQPPVKRVKVYPSDRGKFAFESLMLRSNGLAS